MAEHASRPGYSYGDELAIGLDLVVDALEGLRATTDARGSVL
jgi:hypothetical protein